MSSGLRPVEGEGAAWSLPVDGEVAAPAQDRLARAESDLRSLSAEILERYEEATLVYRLCDGLGAAMGEEGIARTVLTEAVGTLGARAGAIWLAAPGAASREVARVPERTALDWHPDAEPARTALREGRAWHRERGPGVEALVALPLPGAGSLPLGYLALAGRADPRGYRSGETKLLRALAALTSAFLRNDRLKDAARRIELRRREDQIACQVHRGLLPARDALHPGIDMAGVSVAAERIGGDYYGYLPMPDGSLVLALADVSGHGVGAAIYMAAMKGALQAETRRVRTPRGLLARVNAALVDDFSDAGVFATAFVARLHPGSRRMDYAAAGHPAPMLLLADGGVRRLEARGPALGLLDGPAFGQGSVELGLGDVLLLFTDGVLEARDAAGAFYGAARLARAARGAPQRDARAVRDYVLEDVVRHRGATAALDDVTLVVARRIAGSVATGRVRRR